MNRPQARSAATRQGQRDRRPLVEVHHRCAGTVRLAVTGEVDSATAGELADAIMHAIHRDHHNEIILDLAAVTFLGCAGAIAILAGHALAARHSARLSAVNVPACAQRSLTLMTNVLTATNQSGRRH